MKISVSLFKTSILFFAMAVMGIHEVQAQSAKDEKETATTLNNMLASKNFVFKAQMVMPLRGSARQLTSDYDVRVSNDTLVTYLPYFGRAYSIPINPDEGGIHFTSTAFKYDIQEKKKGWDVVIQPGDTKDVRQLMLSISKGGYATLQVTSNDREPISFNGYITQRQQGKRK